MPALDFTEIAVPTAGSGRDVFELFARDVLDLLGFKVLEGPDRGADGGRDLLVEELRTGVGGETRVRWVVSCKHKAHSGGSVNPNDESDIQDRLNTHQCAAFLGFYSTVPSAGLTGKLSGAVGKFEHQIFDPERIERALLGSADGVRLAKRYFPRSVTAWQATSKGPARIFAEIADIKCDYCDKSLVAPELHGIVSIWHPYDDTRVNSDRTEHIYFACKGVCDDRLRAPLRAERMIDGWEDIPDLAIPTVYLRWVMSLLNELQGGKTYSDQAFDKMKDLLLNLFPLVCRHPSDQDTERVRALVMRLTESERMELQRQSSARNGRADSARRARLVLLLADGFTWAEIRAKLDCPDSYISRWSKRFEAERLSGLFARHAGRERYKVTEKVEARVLAWTTKRKPADGSTQWSSRKLAAELGGDISHMTVARIWARHGLKPHWLEGYIASNDPDFEAKAADIIGLYLNPPQHAAVFCVDEKTAIQALDRKDPVLPLSPGRAERHGFEYFRHGTLSLYAAFNTKTGEVLGKTAERHTSAEFVAFLTDLVANHPARKEIHVIADNLSAHKTKRVDEFLAEHNNVHLHFTPTYSSWLNQVELWFAKIERDVIARGVFTSVPDLKRKLMRYIRQYNKNAKPVKWKYFDPSRRITPDSIVTVH